MALYHSVLLNNECLYVAIDVEVRTGSGATAAAGHKRRASAQPKEEVRCSLYHDFVTVRCSTVTFTEPC
jgi:hypothetical protein